MSAVVTRQRSRQMEKTQEAEPQKKQDLQHKGYLKLSENKPIMAEQETIQRDEEGYSERKT